MKDFSSANALLALVFLSAAACSHRAPASAQQTRPSANIAAIRANNIGVAEMNRGRPTEALSLFQQAWRLDPSLLAARLNEGIALLNLQRFDEATDVLSEAVRQQPESARAWYNLGILYRNVAQFDPAIKAFEQVVRIDPGDADALYFLGQLHFQVGRYAEAITWFQRCLALDSLHLSAEFNLARAYQLSGDQESARQHLSRFDQLTQSGIGKPISLSYGEQGPYSTAEAIAGVDLAPPEFDVRFDDVTAKSGLRVGSRRDVGQPGRILPLLGSGACVIDFDADGRLDLVLLGAQGAALFRNTGGGEFADVTSRAGFGQGETLACAAADYDNDGLSDIAMSLADRIILYRSLGEGRFEDVTTRAGIRVDGVPLGITFVDYDHDGDVDLYVSRFLNMQLPGNGDFNFPFGQTGAGNVLWRNNGDGTFTDWTAEAGLAGDAPSIAAAAADYNNDRAVDFFLSGWRPSVAVLANAREGPFRPVDVWKSPFPAPAAGIVPADFDKDGWLDLAVTHWGSPGLSLWKNLEGNGFERVALPEHSWRRGWGVAALDMDNDGWLDLAAVGEGERDELVLLRNLGGNRFVDVTKEAAVESLGLSRPRALVAGDTDGDGDTDLLVTQNGAAPVLLQNDGGSRRRSVRLVLEGLHDNRSAIGTKVEVFAGALRQKWEVSSASGYLGQSSPEILAGIGEADEADLVRLLWPTGVPQDEVQLAQGSRHVVKEIDRRGSSCPVVFVWNGERYEFVSDIIGPGIVGEWVGPGERNVPDPTEYLKIDGDRVKAKNGRLSVRIAEVMEELTYLDQVRLLAVDHPSDVTVNPNEYFASQPPFPEFKVITTRNAGPPRSAVDDRGRDVLPELRSRDRRYVAGFESLPYPGYAKMHYLEMDLGPVDPQQPLRLVMHGFIDYFTVTSIFAAYQGDVQPVVPFLEVRSENGTWTRVSDDIGFPAGLARTMIADLTGKIPAGVSRVRIGTNLKIYWDQILVDRTPQTTPVGVHEIPVTAASLAFHGFPRRLEGEIRGDVSYVHEDVSLTGPFSRPSGYYTAYGDVISLVRDSDERFAIIGSGDEVALEFDAAGLPSLPAGWSRDYFLYADGFAKDMDFYSAHADTVEPLPFHAMGSYPYGPGTQYPADALHLHYRLETNTRFQDGETRSYRFQYENSRTP